MQNQIELVEQLLPPEDIDVQHEESVEPPPTTGEQSIFPDLQVVCDLFLVDNCMNFVYKSIAQFLKIKRNPPNQNN